VYSQRDFFYAVLPQGGLPCIAWKAPDFDGGFSHKVFNNVEELCEYTSNLDYMKANYYFAVSTLKAPSVTIAGKKRVRVQQNMELTRCLILDIDLKDGHYKTVDEALDAANALGDQYNMPRPIAVSSGGGVHIYWPMAAGIPSDEWIAFTKQFRKASQLFHPGLFADSSRVSDSASVLRIPDSYNLKYDEPRAVEIIQWATDVLDLDELRAHFPQQVSPQKQAAGVSLSIASDSTPTALSKIVKNCDWVKDYLQHRGDANEPEWYAMLGLAPYIVHETKDGKVLNGADIAQLISQGHDAYDAEATSIKFMQAKQAQTGPTTCERFRGLKSERCAQCPFANAVKTPLGAAALARPATKEKQVTTTVVTEEGEEQKQEVTIPLYPAPYFRGEDGGVYIRVKEKQEDGTWAEVIERIYDYDLYATKRFRAESVEVESMQVQVWLPRDGLKEFKLPTALLAEGKKLATFLAEKGVVPEMGRAPRVAKYMVDYVRHLQVMGVAEVEFSRFGWRDAKSANPKFVVGNGYIDKVGALQPAAFAHFLRDAAKSVATAGTLEEWKEGFGVYKNIPHSEAFILAAMMGFAAPLMTFTPYKGVLYNMVGSSAAGKSTALQVMTSVWGQPQETHIKISGGRGRDTEVAMYNLIGYLNAVPVAMDELTNMEPENLSDFALSFTSGRGKMRATRDGQNRLNETEWETIVVGTSNTSMYEKLAANRQGYSAEAMRIFELKVPPSDVAYNEFVKAHMDKIKKKYGHAGRVYMNYVIKNLDKIQPILNETINKITRDGQLRNDERFWGAMFACVLVGGTIAKRLGLHDYDIGAIVQKFTNHAPEVREAVRLSQTDATSLLSDFFNNKLDGIIKMQSDGRPYLGLDGRGLGSLRSIVVRMELDENAHPKQAYISIPAFREYCNARKIDFAWLGKELKDSGILLKSNVNNRLAAGSGIPSTSIKCYVVDMTHPKLADISQDVMAETSYLDEQASQ
jgi:energy-coupling factor transporter ATP-binding protein EcfA2